MVWTPATSGKAALVRKAAWLLENICLFSCPPGARRSRAGGAAEDLSILQLNLLVAVWGAVVSLALDPSSTSPW